MITPRIITEKMWMKLKGKKILMLKLSLSSYLNFILISTIPRRWLIVTIIFIIIDDVNKKWKSCRVVRKQSFCKCSSSSLTLSSMMSFLSSSWTVLFDFSTVNFLYIAIMSIMDVPSKEKKSFPHISSYYYSKLIMNK